MAKYRQLCEREMSGGGNYSEYCAPPGINRTNAENNLFPENYTHNLYVGASADRLNEYYAPNVYKGTLEGGTLVEYKTPPNMYQEIQGEILNGDTPLYRIKDTLEISKYTECYAHPNLCILTSKGDTFSDYNTPSNVYIGTLKGGKITEYRATQNIFKITPTALKDVQYPHKMPETINFAGLKISDHPTSSMKYTSMPAAAPGTPKSNEGINDNPFNKSLEEVDVFTYSALLPWEVFQNCTKDAKFSKHPKSDDTTPHEKEAEDPFPPILNKRKPGERNEDDCSIILHQPKDAKSTATAEADTTCSKNEDCECDKNSVCTCPKMRGKYYEYYQQMKEKEYYTMYPKGKCILPKGTVLYFTGAPDNMKREDIHKAFEILGAKIEFIDYQKGNKDGWVRLSFPYEARIIIKKMTDKKLKIADAELVFRVLSGKEEKRYLNKVIEDIYKLQQKGKSLSKLLKKRGFKYVKNIN